MTNEQNRETDSTKTSDSEATEVGGKPAEGTSTFLAWCKNQLTTITREQWKEAIEGANEDEYGLLDLLHRVVDKDHSFSLGHNLELALETFGKELLHNSGLADDKSIDLLQTATSSLEVDSMRILGEQLLKEMKSINPSLSEHFFQIFGDVLKLGTSEIESVHFIPALARPIVEQDCWTGLEWVIIEMKKDPSLFSEADDARKNDLISIVRSKLQESSEAVQPQLVKFAALIGLEEKEEKDGETNEDAG